jgi:hypothetical protein
MGHEDEGVYCSDWMRDESEAVLIGWDKRLMHCTLFDKMGYEDEGLLFSVWMR